MNRIIVSDEDRLKKFLEKHPESRDEINKLTEQSNTIHKEINKLMVNDLGIINPIIMFSGCFSHFTELCGKLHISGLMKKEDILKRVEEGLNVMIKVLKEDGIGGQQKEKRA